MIFESEEISIYTQNGKEKIVPFFKHDLFAI